MPGETSQCLNEGMSGSKSESEAGVSGPARRFAYLGLLAVLERVILLREKHMRAAPALSQVLAKPNADVLRRQAHGHAHDTLPSDGRGRLEAHQPCDGRTGAIELAGVTMRERMDGRVDQILHLSVPVVASPYVYVAAGDLLLSHQQFDELVVPARLRERYQVSLGLFLVRVEITERHLLHGQLCRRSHREGVYARSLLECLAAALDCPLQLVEVRVRSRWRWRCRCRSRCRCRCRILFRCFGCSSRP